MIFYRLNNNSFNYKEAFVDYKAMRGMYETLSVSFSESNTSLNEKLIDGWKPINVRFEADSYSRKKDFANPDLSVWNLSCLVLSQKAYDLLNELLSPFGEIFPLNDNYYLFNCMESIDSSYMEPDQCEFEIESAQHEKGEEIELLGIPKKIALKTERLDDKLIFKPGFAHNSFLICQQEFRNVVEANQLGGLLFEQDLAQIFPKQ